MNKLKREEHMRWLDSLSRAEFLRHGRNLHLIWVAIFALIAAILCGDQSVSGKVLFWAYVGCAIWAAATAAVLHYLSTKRIGVDAGPARAAQQQGKAE